MARYPASGAGWQDLDLEQWAEQWHPATTELTAPEKDAIARIAQDSDLVLDAAASFADRTADYLAFGRALTDRALASGDPTEEPCLDLLLAPWKYRVYGCHLETTLSLLWKQGPALCKALAGKPQSDTTGLMSIVSLAAQARPVTDPTRPLDIREGTIYPPYERVTNKWRPEVTSRAQRALNRLKGWLRNLQQD